MQAWQALDAVQASKRPPQPAENDSGLSPVDLSLPLRFSSDSWDLELSGSTGAIIGLAPRAQQAQQAEHAQQCGCGGGKAAEGCGAAGQGAAASWDRERVELRRLSELGGAPAAEELGAGEEERVQGQPKGGRQQSGMHAKRAQQGAGFASKDYPLAEIVYSTYSGERLCRGVPKQWKVGGLGGQYEGALMPGGLVWSASPFWSPVLCTLYCCNPLSAPCWSLLCPCLLPNNPLHCVQLPPVLVASALVAISAFVTQPAAPLRRPHQSMTTPPSGTTTAT